jgi:precorrin-3B synthase
MNDVAIRGWCPGALQPMRSGDGLVVRIRPHASRTDAAQAMGLAELAERHGNGILDLTNRANLQIRGVSDASYLPLIEGLARLALLDPDPDTEARRNVLMTPFWTEGDEIASIAAELEQALATGPAGVPTKFGFAVDCGRERVLAGASADVRIERAVTGHLIVRADGAELGRQVTRTEAVNIALALTEWFVASGGARGSRGRMAAHIGAGARPPEALCGNARPARSQVLPGPGVYPQGAMFAMAFGQLTSTALRSLGNCARALRMTPWRMILAEGMHEMPHCEGLIADAEDPILRVVACSGAPRCGQAHADTRTLAAVLAPHITEDARLHVSGCAKGCAHSGQASITLVATREGFDLIRGGSVRDVPVLRGLSRSGILTDPSVLQGAR